MSIRDLLQPTAGSVIELGRETVEAFDSPVNCTVLAHGKTVMVKEQCGVRLADVIRLAERIRRRGQQAARGAQSVTRIASRSAGSRPKQGSTWFCSIHGHRGPWQ